MHATVHHPVGSSLHDLVAVEFSVPVGHKDSVQPDVSGYSGPTVFDGPVPVGRGPIGGGPRILVVIGFSICSMPSFMLFTCMLEDAAAAVDPIRVLRLILSNWP